MPHSYQAANQVFKAWVLYPSQPPFPPVPENHTDPILLNALRVLIVLIISLIIASSQPIALFFMTIIGKIGR